MSLYGYSDALSQGAAFNARVKNYNDGVLAANQRAQDVHDKLVKDQKGKVSGDKMKEDEDGAIYGAMDAKSFLGAGAGLIEAGSGVREHGVVGYLRDATKGRLNTIQNTARRAVTREPPPPPVKTELSEVDEDGIVTESIVDDTKAGANAAEAAGNEIESSGLGTSLIKKGLKAATRGAIGEAGLTTLSEVGGKALGDFGGVTDIVKGFENLHSNKGFFAGETTGDKFQEAGAALDLIGTVFPPAEVVGGLSSLIGGAISTYDDIKADADKKTDDGKTIPPPKQTAIKVSPAFSTMGLVASAPISAKQSITGG